MAILLKVKWVDQEDAGDPYLRITHIGGKDGQFHWKHTHAQAVSCIEDGSFTYYVEKDARALRLEVGLAPNGGKYLKAPDDTSHPGWLLNLPQFPKPAPA
ncbi:MAG TPA: hypothetical protein VK815_06485 [Candidatus Acidoferrales bacterium]|jgi:hypothetical protein|nr:hypothetical protein [Candidatus Acidoferrales bacterium]